MRAGCPRRSEQSDRCMTMVAGTKGGGMRKVVILGLAEAMALAIVAVVFLGIGSGYM